MRKRYCFRHGRPDCGCDFRNLPRLIEPGLLLLLKEHGGSHGYDLTEKLQELGLSESTVEAGAVYRSLRQLEAEGHVRSTWDTTGNGPARRQYVLTPLGEALLSRWAEVLRRRSGAMVQFVDRYYDAGKQRAKESKA